MSIYISRGRFTSQAVKGMLAKPENREQAVAKPSERRREAHRVVLDVWSPRLAGHWRVPQREGRGFCGASCGGGR